MIAKRIIPCLDIRDGRVVKGVRFKGLSDVSDPVELGRYYSDMGADELVFYDIAASAEGRKLFSDVLRKVAAHIFIPLTVGGGIHEMRDFDMALNSGADKVSVNTGAIACPALIKEAAAKYGSQCVVISVDVKRVDGEYRVFAKGGREDTGLSFIPWLKKAVELGAGEAVINSIDTDGVKKGFDIEMLQAAADAVDIPIIASGGAGSMEDFGELFRKVPGVDAGLAASIFHFGEVEIPALKRYLLDEGISMRPPAAS